MREMPLDVFIGTDPCFAESIANQNVGHIALGKIPSRACTIREIGIGTLTVKLSQIGISCQSLNF
jgi:hypothetical protein